MAWRFQRRIKIIPGVRINISKGGISTTVGVRGASITIGKDGVYSNVGIPGSGLSCREKIVDFNNNNSNCNAYNATNSESFYDKIHTSQSNLQQLSDFGLTDICDMINTAKKERKQIKKDIRHIKFNIFLNVIYKVFMYVVYPFVKANIKRIEDDIQVQRNVVDELHKSHENCYMPLDVDLDEATAEAYDNLILSFNKVIYSKQIWNIPSYRYVDMVKERSNAAKSVDRINSKWSNEQNSEIKYVHDVPCIKDSRSNQLYVYPTFVVVSSKSGVLAVVDIKDVEISVTPTKFEESEQVPNDSKVLYYTWYKVNKNGTRDLRFNNNYQIPVVEYANVTIRSENGLDECYLISDYESAHSFYEYFAEYKKCIVGI